MKPSESSSSSSSFRGGWGGKGSGRDLGCPTRVGPARQPGPEGTEEVIPGRNPGNTERVGRELWEMCVVCDFNLVLGRRGRAGIPPESSPSNPIPSVGCGVSWCPSLPCSRLDLGSLPRPGGVFFALPAPFWEGGEVLFSPPPPLEVVRE